MTKLKLNKETLRNISGNAYGADCGCTCAGCVTPTANDPDGCQTVEYTCPVDTDTCKTLDTCGCPPPTKVYLDEKTIPNACEPIVIHRRG